MAASKSIWKWLKIMLNEGERYLAAIFCLCIIGLLFAQVVSRYVFNISLTWAEEMALIMFIWMVYLSIAAAVLQRKHIRVDFLTKRLPTRLKRGVLILDDLIMMAYCLIMMAGVLKIIERFALGNPASLLLGIPKTLSWSIIPIGLGLTCIRLVQDIVVIFGEEEETLGVVKGTLDLESIEAEYQASARAKGNGDPQ